MADDMERRKREPLDQAPDPAVERPGSGPGFEDVHLVHDALAEPAFGTPWPIRRS